MSRITDKQLIELIKRRNLPSSDPRHISREAMGKLLDGTLEKMVPVAVGADPGIGPVSESTKPEPVLLWRPLHATAIEVNLGAPPNRPFTNAQLDWKTEGQTGWAKVELKDGKLFISGREVVLHLTDGQKFGVVKGHIVRKSLKNKAVLHSNVLDALFENQHLIPESWKQNKHGETLLIFFWAQGFRGLGRKLCVWCIFWNGSQWYRNYDYLDDEWRANNPAACAS